MKIFMEDPNKIMKLPIFFFWIFEKLNLVSKLENDLNQFWILNFISLLGKNLPLTNIYKMYSSNFLDKLETQE